MSLNEFFAKLKRYNENANVIFDDEEPIGHATDMVMPYKRWFKRSASPGRSKRKVSPAAHSAAATKR